jgi:hypothetical protein
LDSTNQQDTRTFVWLKQQWSKGNRILQGMYNKYFIDRWASKYRVNIIQGLRHQQDRHIRLNKVTLLSQLDSSNRQDKHLLDSINL